MQPFCNDHRAVAQDLVRIGAIGLSRRFHEFLLQRMQGVVRHQVQILQPLGGKRDLDGIIVQHLEADVLRAGLARVVRFGIQHAETTSCLAVAGFGIDQAEKGILEIMRVQGRSIAPHALAQMEGVHVAGFVGVPAFGNAGHNIAIEYPYKAFSGIGYDIVGFVIG